MRPGVGERLETEMTVAETGVTIRPARLLDAEGVARVHVESWQETYRGIMPRHFLNARTVKGRTALWQTALSQLGSGQVFLVAEDEEGAVVGFVSGGPARDPAFCRGGEIYALYLLGRFHGRGIGRALFERCRDELRQAGRGRLYLWVLRANPSRGFYLKMGGRAADRGEVVRGGQVMAEERFVWD